MNVQEYLLGLVTGMPSSAPAAAQEAQAVVSRTDLNESYDPSGRYGSSFVPSGFQVSGLGWTGEERERDDARNGGVWTAAVAATTAADGEGTVLVDHDGQQPYSVPYSRSNGGMSERTDFAAPPFGITPYIELAQIDDSRWELAADDPDLSWATSVSLAQLASSFGLDTVTDVAVAPRGDPHRQSVDVTGRDADGHVAQHRVNGQAFLSSLGEDVRSTGFTFQVIPHAAPAAPTALGATALVGDWDGDGKQEPGWFRDGRIALARADGTTTRYRYGTAGDVPVVGDWDGDGVDTVAVFRRGSWYLRDAPGGGATDRIVRFGRSGDRPVAGRWRGGRVDGIGVVRTGTWYVHYGAAGPHVDLRYAWGRASDVPLVGDWDGNGTDSPGLVRGNRWYLTAAVGAPVRVTAQTAFGRASGDVPVQGDWDGNRTSTPGVVRGTTFYERALLASGGATSVAFTG